MELDRRGWRGILIDGSAEIDNSIRENVVETTRSILAQYALKLVGIRWNGLLTDRIVSRVVGEALRPLS